MSHTRLAHENSTGNGNNAGGYSPSLRLSEPGDFLEREADHVADGMMAGRIQKDWSISHVAPGSSLQRKCDCGGECDECKQKQLIQRKSAGSGPVAASPSSVHDGLNSPGRPLDARTRNFFEPRFGTSLDEVTIHSGASAAQSAKAVNARAYTVGNRIVMADQQYAPHSADGQRLLAHELTHVVQQRSGTGPQPGMAQETEAESAANQIASGAQRVPVHRESRAGIARVPGPPQVGPTVTQAIKDALIDKLFSSRLAAPAAGIRQNAIRTFAAAAIIRPDGSVTYESAYYDIGMNEHAEPQLMQKIAPKVQQGDTVAIAIDQMPCGPNKANCSAGLKGFREPPEHGSLRVYTVRALRRDTPPGVTPEVATPEQMVSPKTAITREAAEKFLVESKEFQRVRLPLYKEPPAGGGATGDPAAPTTDASAGGGAGKGAPAGQPSAPNSVDVGTKIEVLSSTKAADGSTIAEVEYSFGKELDQLNKSAQGAEIPAKLRIRVTQSASGEITAVESLSGQPKSLVEALAKRTLMNSAGGEAGAIEGGTAGIGRGAMLVKGLKIGGWAAMAVMTGYQLYKGAPVGRVAAGTAGGVAAGAVGTYLVCNLLLDAETAGAGIVICGFIVGGLAGSVGTAQAEQAYDEAQVTDLDRAMLAMNSKDANVRSLFNIMVAKMGDSSNCVNADFVNGFLGTLPGHLQESETILLAGQLASKSIAPSRNPVPKSRPAQNSAFPKTSDPCPSCHGRSQASLQPGIPRMDPKDVDAFAAMPTCDQIRASALAALHTSVGTLPRYYRAPDDKAHHPDPGVPAYKAPRRPDPNAFPTIEEQTGKGKCTSGNCHAENQQSKPLLTTKPLTDAEKAEMMKAVLSQKTPPSTGNAHATPPGVHLSPTPQGFPSLEEQQGECPTCHKSTKKDDPFKLRDFNWEEFNKR